MKFFLFINDILIQVKNFYILNKNTNLHPLVRNLTNRIVKIKLLNETNFF